MSETDLKRLPPGRQPRWLKFIVRSLFWLAFGGPDVRGIENVPRSGPLIVAPTHRSYLDPVILSAFLPRTLYCMGKKELFRNRLFGALLRFFGTFPVDREAVRGSTFRTALDLLGKGGAVVIFPEGGIVNSMGEQGFKEGVGSLANMSRAPILPVFIEGSNTLFNWRAALSDTPSLVLWVGEPIPPGEKRGREGRERTARLTSRALHELKGKYEATKDSLHAEARE